MPELPTDVAGIGLHRKKEEKEKRKRKQRKYHQSGRASGRNEIDPEKEGNEADQIHWVGIEMLIIPAMDMDP